MEVSYLTGSPPHFPDVGQDMKQTYLYMWYPLFQVQWDRCDQQSPNFALFSEKHKSA
jgi:hypothetical protein